MNPLLYEKAGSIATITFNRPEARNAKDPETFVRLAESLLDFKKDETLRVAIITGAGNEAFSAGADLKKLIPLLSGARPPEDEWDHRVLEDPEIRRVALLRHHPIDKPLIAAVNGVCAGGGMELLQATDIRIAASHAKFGLTEAKRGLVPGGSLVRLIRQVPFAWAMQLMLTGELISAEQAERIGLVNTVVPAEELMNTAMTMATAVADNGPVAVQAIKRVVRLTSGLPLEQSFIIETDAAQRVLNTEDAKEGARAFAEKRQPRFVGR
jgi:enoyl-CoA hydratase